MTRYPRRYGRACVQPYAALTLRHSRGVGCSHYFQSLTTLDVVLLRSLATLEFLEFSKAYYTVEVLLLSKSYYFQSRTSLEVVLLSRSSYSRSLRILEVLLLSRLYYLQSRADSMCVQWHLSFSASKYSHHPGLALTVVKPQ